MTKTDTDIVTAVQDAMESRIGSDRYEVWFQDKVTFEHTNGSIRIGLSDEFALDQLRRSFGRVVIEVVESIAGDDTSIEWRATASVERNSQQRARSTDTLHPSVDDKQLPTSKSLTNGVDGLQGNSNWPSSVIGASPADMTIPMPATSEETRSSSNSDVVDANSRDPRRRRNRHHGTFATFVSGDNSRLAFAACQSVSTRLGEVSPIFIHGPTGSGKTHLLQSVYADTMRRTRAGCVSVSAEQFTSGFLEALHGHGLPSFRRKFRSSDLLIIDDVQFFVGKRATLIELLHTIDTLTTAGKQIVLAADRPPSEINGLNAEIIARLSGGLVCGIEYPNSPTRRRLTEHLAAIQAFPMSEDIGQLISDEIRGDARLIKGALIRLNAIAHATGQPVTVDLARSELTDIFQAGNRQPAIADIERVVCEVFGVNVKQLQSGGKSKLVSQPRMLAMWLARKHTRAAYSEIGDYFGGRSHSTVISANHRVEEWVGCNRPIRVAHGESPVVETIRRIETTLRAV